MANDWSTGFELVFAQALRTAAFLWSCGDSLGSGFPTPDGGVVNSVSWR